MAEPAVFTRSISFRIKCSARDTSGTWRCTNQTVATYNQSTATWAQMDAQALPSATINGIDMTVLPLTPLNPLRAGLAHVTTAIASGGGVSVIRADGVVCNSSTASTQAGVAFLEDGRLVSFGSPQIQVASPAQYMAPSFVYYSDFFAGPTSAPRIGTVAKAFGNKFAYNGIAPDASLVIVDARGANNAGGAFSRGMHAIASSSYNTGWLAGGSSLKLALPDSSADLSSKADAATLTDRSPAAAAVTVHGGINRVVVATGAELAGLAGFTTANYVTTTPIALGTTDFDIATAIVGASVTGTQFFWAHGYYTAGAYSGARTWLTASGSTLTFFASDGTNSQSLTATIAAGQNYHVRCSYRATTNNFELWINGVRVGVAARGSVATLTNASASMFVGIDPALASPCAATALALIKATLYAPTPDQIAVIYADEARMFLANAKCLLLGSSTVQGISHDPDTDQLAVATAVGTNLFKGLQRVGYQQSTTGVNLLPSSDFEDTINTPSALNGTLSGRLNSGPSGWGADAHSWTFTENGVTGTHRTYLSNGTSGYALPAKTFVVGIPLEAGSRSWGYLFSGVAGAGGLYVNLATGVNGTASNGATALAPVNLGGGWWLVQYAFTLAAGASPYFALAPATADGTQATIGDNGASGPAFSFGKPIVRAGATALTAADYVYALAANDNHKSVAFSGGDLVIASAAGVDAFMQAAPGLRETAKGQASPKRWFYDPTRGVFSGLTVDATPTLLSSVPIPEGKAFRFRATVSAIQSGGTATEKAVYVIEGLASRDIGGNVLCRLDHDDGQRGHGVDGRGRFREHHGADPRNQRHRQSLDAPRVAHADRAVRRRLADGGLKRKLSMQIDDTTSGGFVRRWTFVAGFPACVQDALPAGDAGELAAYQRNAGVRSLIALVEPYEAAQRLLARGEPESEADATIPNPSWTAYNAAQALVLGAAPLTVQHALWRSPEPDAADPAHGGVGSRGNGRPRGP